MTPAASPALRWARAGAVGGVAFLAGVGAHVSADGLLPGVVGLAVLALCCAAGSAVFLGCRASTLRLVVLVVGGQGFVHTGLAALAGHRGDPVSAHVPTAVPAPAPPPAAALDRSGSYFDQWAQANPALHGQHGGPVVPSWLVHSIADVAAQPMMALTHVLAAVAVGLWLAVGERALFALLALTAGLVLAAVDVLLDALVTHRPALPRPVPLRPTAWPTARRPRTRVRATPVRRGPPVLLPAR